MCLSSGHPPNSWCSSWFPFKANFGTPAKSWRSFRVPFKTNPKKGYRLQTTRHASRWPVAPCLGRFQFQRLAARGAGPAQHPGLVVAEARQLDMRQKPIYILSTYLRIMRIIYHIYIYTYMCVYINICAPHDLPLHVCHVLNEHTIRTGF